MGRYTAECPHCKELISFRDEHTQWATWLEEEYNKGFSDGLSEKESIEAVRQKNEALRQNWEANLRVMKAEIEKQVREEDKRSVQKS